MKKKDLPKNVRERDGRYTYRYSVTVTDEDTGRKRPKQLESPAFSTPKEAEDFGVIVRAKKLQGKLVYEKNITVATWGKVWLKEYKSG